MGRALVTRDIDRTRMSNWKNRLKTEIGKLSILFDTSCTRNQAIDAWGGFFNHAYWADLSSKIEKSQINESFSVKSIRRYDDTEQFIEDQYLVSEIYDATISV